MLRKLSLMPVVWFAAMPLLASAATLSTQTPVANAGETVAVSITLSSTDAPISGLQFDMSWDPQLDVHMAAGAEIGLSNKTLYTSFVETRKLRFLVAGTNNSNLIDGELLRLFITVLSGAAQGQANVTFGNLIATDNTGGVVILNADPIVVQIQSAAPTHLIQSSGILNAGSLAAGPISPGEIVTLFGSISAPSPQVFVNNVPAPIIYAGANQINAIVPFGLNLETTAEVTLQRDTSIASTTVPVAAAAPAIFTLNATGTGPGAILNQDYSVNSFSRPASAGSVLMVYGTGFGTLSPLPVDGQLAQTSAVATTPVTATIKGLPAQVIYAGAAPGLIYGVIQVNVVVPSGLAPDPVAPILLSTGSFTTQPGVTVSIQ